MTEETTTPVEEVAVTPEVEGVDQGPIEEETPATISETETVQPEAEPTPSEEVATQGE